MTDKCKHDVDVTGKFNLKKTGEDAKKSNYNPMVHKPNPPLDNNISKSKDEIQSSQMEKRLDYVKLLLWSLPDYLS